MSSFPDHFPDHILSVLIAASVLLNLFFLRRHLRNIQANEPKLQSLALGANGRTLHTRDYFYIGGTHVPHDSSMICHGQMYVEHLAPAQVTRRIPIIFIHGNGMTGANWLNTPDGRPGWSDYFLNMGYEVKPVSPLSPKRLHDVLLGVYCGPTCPGTFSGVAV